MWAAAAGLLIWQAALFGQTFVRGRQLHFDVALRRQHYIQALVQVAIFSYWGWYWRPVYDELPLFVAQLAFAYAFDSLLTWSRRDKWIFGFGPFPVILSTNVFLWFREDWYFLQFAMVACGLLAKEFIRWNRNGKLTHVFNPSAFSLSVFSFGLVLTGQSDLTSGQNIATTLFMPPHIFPFLFCLGLIAMYFFSVTLVAGVAAATLFGLSALYTSQTGVYWFVDAEIPIAVFLGLLLLITDPSTSPRSFLGKAVFGLGYGVLTFLSFGVLWWMGVPTFYDKLLPIPILNLSVRAIDRFIDSGRFEWLSFDRFGFMPTLRQANLGFMSVWILFFLTMSATGRAGDTHPGKWVPFWQDACDQGLPGGCRNLMTVDSVYCDIGSGWACNELGAHYIEDKIVAFDSVRATEYFTLACRIGNSPACANAIVALTGMPNAPIRREDPTKEDLYVLLRGGKSGLPVMPDSDLYSLACDQGWATFCDDGS